MNQIAECKKTATIILKGAGFTFDKLTARTVSFQDLARAECVFVKPHGLKAAGVYGAWDLARAMARDHGFRLEE